MGGLGGIVMKCLADEWNLDVEDFDAFRNWVLAISEVERRRAEVRRNSPSHVHEMLLVWQQCCLF